MTTDRKEALLFTPGPLTTTLSVKQAMLRDWGSWDQDFHRLTQNCCQQLLDIANAKASHVCIPLQGSGTFAVEAAIATLVPRDGKVLIPSNGAYCQRIVRICKYLQRNAIIMEVDEDQTFSAQQIDQRLAADKTISHVALVHCETSSGIMNPIKAINDVIVKHGRKLIIDAKSTFGAINIDANEITFDALISSANKCLQGIPGMGFVITRKSALERCQHNAHSLSLDLYDQYDYLEKTQQWRFTPPTHVIAALSQALDEYALEGGLKARHQRYRCNQKTLVNAMAQLGFKTFLSSDIQSPIITTFLNPENANFDFSDFYHRLHQRGFIIYPGKLTTIDTFRIGTMGDIDENTILNLIQAIKQVLFEMNVTLTSATTEKELLC